VRVNGILPGIVPTPMSRATLDGEAFAGTPERYPLGVGRVEDVVAMARFLLSEEARWITGALFGVDGGHTAA
jgi:NAD(P)-dependent dehydrogenase (short-subunit alcohol dehydrogenase family)